MRGLISLVLVFVFLHLSVPVSQGQEDEDEFVQEGIVSNTDESPETDPFRLFMEAQDAHESGDLEKALELYAAALKELPEFPEAEYQRGTIYQTLNRFEEAEASYRKALEYKPDWTLALAGLGSVLVSRGSNDEAEKVLSKAIDIEPMTFPAYIAITSLYLSRNTATEKIKALYGRLVYITSKSNVPGGVWSSRGALERVLGNFDEARKSLRRSLEIEPGNRRSMIEQAELAIAMDDYEGAINLSNSLAIRFPEDLNVKVLLARSYALKGMTSKALEILDSLKDRNAQAFQMAETIRNHAGGLDLAALEAKLAESPEDAEILGTLCTAYRRGDPRKALDYCRKAYELEPGNIGHAIGFGAALIQMHQYQSAVKVLEELQKIDAENHTVRANLATAYFQLGKYEDAKLEYRWIVEKQPELPAGYYFLAITHDRLSEFVNAMANYQQFLRIADATEYEDEIGRVRLRMPTLQKQIDKGKKK